MKIRLIIAVICLLFSVLFSLFVFLNVQRVCKTLMEEAETILNGTESDGAVFEKARSLCETWEARSAAFCLFVHHRDADELRRRFLQVEKQAQAGDLTGVREALQDCWISLLVVMEGEKPKLTNIF